MKPSPNHPTDKRLHQLARHFQYPQTPDVTVSVLKRLNSGNRTRGIARSAWAIASTLILLLVAILFAVPGVRAEIVRFFQVGVVRIFPAPVTETAMPSLPGLPTTATPAVAVPLTATPGAENTSSTPMPELSVAVIAGETSLEAAQSRLPFPVRLPSYPPDLGYPERVFLQDDDTMVILVWTEQDDPQKARLSLQEIGPGSVLIRKFAPRVIQETQVNGHYAVWAEGPYLVELSNGSFELQKIVAGNTLIWEESEITYRLETNLTLEEAVHIAESLE